jgi:hypothetical protein
VTRSCPDCKTVSLATAPYCDACGRDLDPLVPTAPRWRLWALSAAIGVAVAVAQYLITGK